ncbi:hypothetical protein HZ326_10217 [Fusarium oxysporum f. sp. albedinis]|nr:hypothetical protein HZ326_10217 [Fusarium oxysporum f. sp. albedinis]
MKEMCLPEVLGLDINQVLEVETGKRFEGGVRKLRLEASKLPFCLMTVIHWQFWRLDKELEVCHLYRSTRCGLTLTGSVQFSRSYSCSPIIRVTGSWFLVPCSIETRSLKTVRLRYLTSTACAYGLIELGCTNGNLNVKASSLPLTTLAPRHARQRRRHS